MNQSQGGEQEKKVIPGHTDDVRVCTVFLLQNSQIFPRFKLLSSRSFFQTNYCPVIYTISTLLWDTNLNHLSGLKLNKFCIVLLSIIQHSFHRLFVHNDYKGLKLNKFCIVLLSIIQHSFRRLFVHNDYKIPKLSKTLAKNSK